MENKTSYMIIGWRNYVKPGRDCCWGNIAFFRYLRGCNTVGQRYLFSCGSSCSYVFCIWESYSCQYTWRAMDELHLGKTTFMTMLSPLTGEHRFNGLGVKNLKAWSGSGLDLLDQTVGRKQREGVWNCGNLGEVIFPFCPDFSYIRRGSRAAVSPIWPSCGWGAINEAREGFDQLMGEPEQQMVVSEQKGAVLLPRSGCCLRRTPPPSGAHTCKLNIPIRQEPCEWVSHASSLKAWQEKLVGPSFVTSVQFWISCPAPELLNYDSAVELVLLFP